MSSAPGSTQDGEATDDAIDVLVRAVTPGTTYLYTRWLDAAAEPRYVAITPEPLAPIHDRLTHALLSPIAVDGDPTTPDAREAAVVRALTRGSFADPQCTMDLARECSDLVFPHTSGFFERLHQERSRGRRVTVRVIPSPSLSRVPFELLPDPDGTPLMELARIVYEVPATVHLDRPRLPSRFDPEAPPLFSIDPRLPSKSGFLPVLFHGPSQDYLHEGLGIQPASRHIDPFTLSEQLRAEAPPSRWLFLGHVSSRDDQPGSAALHLSTPHNGAPDGSAALMRGNHRPFTAIDLLLGVPAKDAGSRAPGHQRWPMPPRVALVACASGSDHASVETFGLVVSAALNGAEFITTTRWVMPTDAAFHHCTGTTDRHPTSDLVIAINQAHADPADPIDALRTWQIERYRSFKATGDLCDTPLLWAGVTTHHVPPRHPKTGAPMFASCSHGKCS